MARPARNKAALSQESAELKGYQRFLPSLDLKRQQLMAERARAKAALEATVEAVSDLERRVAEVLPMACNRDLDLTGLAAIRAVHLGEENLMGVRLPVVADLDIAQAAYPLLGRPHWVDALQARLVERLTLGVQERVQKRRLALLDAAVRKVTQRVNLFEKRLIPQAKANIQRIRVALSDAERAAVVRSKIAKRKHAQAR